MSETALSHDQHEAPIARLLEIDDVAALLRVSRSLLAKWRMLGKGPRFIKAGRRILYDRRELKCWLDNQTRLSTTDEAN